jgi:polyphosphate glucokinase
MPLSKLKSVRRTGSKRVAARQARAPGRPQPSPRDAGAGALTTLCIDIGGTGIKMISLDARGRPLTERARVLTPQPAKPAAVLSAVRGMLDAQPRFDRVSVGFPGVVIDGVVHTAVNLGTEFWKGHDLKRDLERLTGAPVQVINDADLQGYGVIEGRGVELVLTLGTGLGSALFVDGRLVPNLELGHHPFKKGKTYEERVCDAALKRIGKKDWTRRVLEALTQLTLTFSPRLIFLGGGNVEHLRAELPKHVRAFTNVDGMTGGIRLWTSP